jgi:hypothetical protein
MKNLSVSQSYLLCVLNEKVKLPTFSTEISICLIAGGMLDLIFAGIVAIDKKKLHVIGNIDNNNQYLKSLYDFIKNVHNVTLEKLVSEYCFSFTNKRLTKFVEDVGETLVKEQCATSEKGGFFGNSTYFIVNPKEVDHVIQTIRAEILESGTMSEEMIALASLFEKSGQLQRYFSKYEKKQLKERISEIRKESSNKLVKEMVDYINTMIAVMATIK